MLLAVAAFGCAQANPTATELDATVDDIPKSDASMSGDADASKGPDSSTPTRCASDDDCRASLAGPVCDTATGTCVRCTPARDMCPAGQFCDPATNACRMGCTNDMDCAGGMGGNVRCDPATRRCVGCTGDGDCALGTLCRMGACVPGCNEAHACGVGQTCCAGQCADTTNDAMNCGTCGNSCGMGGACCMGTCRAAQTDVMNCGRCGNACEAANGVAGCAMGACAVASCSMGFGDCDRMAANGCEANLQTDSMHCGACGMACTSGANATSRCMAGRCVNECAAGFGDCDGNPANGCETAVSGDPSNCGMCGRLCNGGANATPACAQGACSFACNRGFGDCDMMEANGCETNLDTTATHCGACGVVCSFPNGVPACEMGRCALARCAPGFDNCDGNPANGCETPVTADNANCGRCGNTCGAGTTCSMGVCGSICSGGTTFCGGRCASLDTDTAHCGMCGRACAGGSNASAACRGGACGLACNQGFGDCDNMASTGCEVNLDTALEHCGACGRACRVPNATAACSGGSCRIGACNTGFANCNGAEADGCETNTAADVANCGACGRACSLPNAGATCGAGACRIGPCAAGFANCNGVDADGCEVNTSNNNFNCGACGRSCAPGTACSGGSCATVCAPGTTFCAGSCVATQTDSRNCGGCGNVCAAGQTCQSGVCRTQGPPNDTCANAQVLSLSAPSQTISTTTVGAASNLNATCGAPGGPDVWFRFTLAQRELVYADTVGTGYDTILFFASSCTSALSGSPAPGQFYCNDDMGSAGCTGGGLQSQVVAVFNPGTYYLVLAGYGSASGPSTVRFHHMPVGSGAVTFLASTSGVYSGATSGGNAIPNGCSGSGPENTYWWKSCPDSPGGTVSATTCSRASWDTVLAIRNSDGAGNICNDDSCGLQSNVSARTGAGAALHLVDVDGYGGSSGSYSVQITRP